MTKLVAINAKKDAERKQDLKEIVQRILEGIESGEVQELICVTLDGEGEATLGAYVQDVVGGMGMFEMGKIMFLATTEE